MNLILSHTVHGDLMDVVDRARRGEPVPFELANRALSALALAQLAPAAPQHLRLIRNDDRTFTTTGGAWTPSRPDAAAILASCAAAPGRWLPTWPDTAVRAVQGRLVRCIDDLCGTDPALARLLRPTRSEHEPGLRLRVFDGQVEARLLLHPRTRIDTA